MTKNRRNHTVQSKHQNPALWAVLLLGCILRLTPGVQTNFPINDGGMILAMIRDLRFHAFLLPPATSYNYSGIPFAYPPFGMYVGAFLSGPLSISEFELLRWLPPLVSAATIPAFYWVAWQIFDSQSKALMATALYAVLPGSYDWLVMGGGLTRSFGILFSLLAIGYAYQLFRRGGGMKTMLTAILFCTLTVLSHPEVGLQTAATSLLFWAYYGRSVSGVKSALLVALGTALLTALWWLPVLRYHGFSPFWSAMHTGIRETLLASLFHTFFSTQGGLPLLPVLGLIGILAMVRKREFILVLWAFLPFFVDPRNAPAVALFPFLMLASEGLYYLNLEFARAYSRSFPTDNDDRKVLSILPRGIFAALLLYLFYISYTGNPNLARISLGVSDRETMAWVRKNTVPGSRFLLLTNTGEISPMTDSFQEWFPVLAERQSRNTLQGLEWSLGSDFFPYSQDLTALQACLDVDCLTDWLKQKNIQVEFILVRTQRASPDLVNSLRADSSYRMVYQSGTAEIFAAP